MSIKRTMLVVIPLLLVSCASSYSMESVTIFYFPFDIDTFASVTKENIYKSGACRFKVSTSDTRLSQINEIFQSALIGEFSDRNVRLAIVGQSNSNFVDHLGGVSVLGKDGVLNQGDFNKLKVIIEDLAKEGSCSEKF